MLSKEFRPLMAPEMETGGADAGDTGGAPPPPAPMNERPVDGPGSGRSNLRKQLESSAAQVRKASETPAPAANDQQARQQRAPRSRARQEAEADTQTAPAEGQEPEAEAGAEGDEQQAAPPVGQPPKAWTAEAKAEWAKVPPTAQAAILKREDDIARGVTALKEHYSGIDEVLKPRLDFIKSRGHSAAAAINQLFLWMDAVAKDKERVAAGQPPLALQALAQSYGIDPREVARVAPQQEQSNQKSEIPDPIQQYFGTFEQKLNQQIGAVMQRLESLGGSFADREQRSADKQVADWSKDKPYFEEVRQTMAELLKQGLIPALEDGTADLDTAYDRAVYMLPEVRGKVLKAQQDALIQKQKDKEEAERKLQQQAADKARRAGGSLSPNAPGIPGAPQQARPGKGKSVRESLMGAIEESRA